MFPQSPQGEKSMWEFFAIAVMGILLLIGIFCYLLGQAAHLIR